MIRAIIVEDEAPARRLIAEYLTDYPDFEIVASCSNGFEGLKQITILKPDVIFLDVQMPKLTGFELLELLDELPLVLFTTAYEQYAIRAFECNATDYLLKPFSKERFAEAINRVSAAKQDSKNEIQRLHKLLAEIRSERGEVDRIVVRSGQKVNVLPLEDIICIEASDDYVIIFSQNKQYVKQMTMKQLENELPKQFFLRIHRSFIVNISHISSFEAHTKETHLLTLSNGKQVATSRTGSQLLKRILI